MNVPIDLAVIELTKVLVQLLLLTIKAFLFSDISPEQVTEDDFVDDEDDVDDVDDLL